MTSDQLREWGSGLYYVTRDSEPTVYKLDHQEIIPQIERPELDILITILRFSLERYRNMVTLTTPAAKAIEKLESSKDSFDEAEDPDMGLDDWRPWDD